MRIDPKKCVACANCVPVCPLEAIYVDPGINRAIINDSECVECGTCFRGMSQEHLNPTLVRMVRALAKLCRFRFDPEPDVCPTAAIEMEELPWPRILRQVFSDPLIEHKSTGIHGRGTEEVKTNDVSGRISIGEAGYVIELGRPGVGVRFHQIQSMTTALAELDISFELKNPVTHLMTDKEEGRLREDLLEEKILSAIIEFKTAIDLVPLVLDTVQKVSQELKTVVAVGVSTRCDQRGEDKVLAPLLKEHGHVFERAKTNLGLGRVTNPQDSSARF